MFKPRELPELVAAPAALVAAVHPPLLTPPAGRALARLETLAKRFADGNWIVDLADGIGSAEWFRGLGLLVAQIVAAIAFLPDFAGLPMAPAMPLDQSAREEFRSQVIQPLALGSDTGRRMGATAQFIPSSAHAQNAASHLTVTLGQGDSFASMLERAGVLPQDAAKVGALVGSVAGGGSLAAGTPVDIVLTGENNGPRRLDHLAMRARFDLDLSVARTGDSFTMSQNRIAVDTTPLRIRGTVGSSLYLSARAVGAPIEAIQQYLEAIDQHMSLDTAIEPGDTFDIIVSYRRASSGEAEVGELLFAGLEHEGRLKAQLLRWGKDGQFFEASGMGQQRSGLIMPVVGGRVTSGFGARRHPVLGYTRLHAGIDFGAAYGSPIYAVSDGAVIFSGWHGGHGNFVKLDHGGGYATGYGHMSRIAVAQGSRVQAGQVIGYVGSTGLSTGPHLHYELYRGGAPVNPMTVSFTVIHRVDPAELAAYKARMAQLKGLKPGAAMASLAPRQASVGVSRGAREIDKLGN